MACLFHYVYSLLRAKYRDAAQYWLRLADHQLVIHSWFYTCTCDRTWHVPCKLCLLTRGLEQESDGESQCLETIAGVLSVEGVRGPSRF